ncbi:hypothetical protein K437DRAFT_239619 [Tilletiaria anomala UBC 951]|uniref:Peroxisomal membrane protein PEX14 n=1 Tax=Tilletiaria anomala (strain ATCC 24038 / CBS 436.72 / UBC 951) TaxID=1037660 RepID=A0A066VG18_TILAU|nr:uncharacterized protein K437DRAFT_239619 [Tilletiaria anomala UBC 951]KDN39243.1 hypothetical protein K437DRAFT_239619 [Tilletiaria anomala UBC 951]
MSDASSFPAAMPGAGPAPHAGSLRPEAISSAVAFLTDPKVSNAPLSQRVSFLESKGLSPSEIDAAMAQAGGGVVARTTPGPYPAYRFPYPPEAQQLGRDWRDWFIMAVVSGTIGYGIINLARKYLYPHLQPPNATILDSDLEALTAKYDEVAAQLSALEQESAGIKSGFDSQKELVETSLKEVEDAVKLVRNGEKKRDDDMSDMKREVDRIRDGMPKMFEKHREAQTSSLAEVQAELKSLKTLLVSRGAAAAGPSGIPAIGRTSTPTYGASKDSDALAASSSGSASPAKGYALPPPVKPSIPAWQLAQPNGAAGSSSKDSNGTLNGIDPASESS